RSASQGRAGAGRGGRSSSQRLAASAPAAQEEETFGQAPMSDHGARADSEPEGEELEPREALQELLEEIAGALGIDAEVEVEERAGELRGNIKGGDVGLFIGRHGQTIDAVQHLAQRIVFPDGPGEAHMVIDAEGYRKRREGLLRDDPDGAAEEALRTERPVEFDPLPSWE